MAAISADLCADRSQRFCGEESDAPNQLLIKVAREELPEHDVRTLDKLILAEAAKGNF